MHYPEKDIIRLDGCDILTYGIVAGDRVRVLHGNSDRIHINKVYTVSSIKKHVTSSYYSSTVRIKNGYTHNGGALHKACVRFVGIDGTFVLTTTNGHLLYEKESSMNCLAIEQDRPTYVREFIEITNAEKGSERSYVGEFIEFKNLTAAKTYCSNQISASIRKSNTYRMFAIFQEKNVARAMKPEIEFA